MTTTPTTPTTPTTQATATALAELFAQRLQKPPRHRLLQGFPSAPLMHTATLLQEPVQPGLHFAGMG